MGETILAKIVQDLNNAVIVADTSGLDQKRVLQNLRKETPARTV
jgi:hypothetical protein